MLFSPIYCLYFMEKYFKKYVQQCEANVSPRESYSNSNFLAECTKMEDRVDMKVVYLKTLLSKCVCPINILELKNV